MCVFNFQCSSNYDSNYQLFQYPVISQFYATQCLPLLYQSTLFHNYNIIVRQPTSIVPLVWSLSFLSRRVWTTQLGRQATGGTSVILATLADHCEENNTPMRLTNKVTTYQQNVGHKSPDDMWSGQEPGKLSIILKKWFSDTRFSDTDR